MLTPSERACLVIADISGYTSYLAGSELDHAQDILADLMETTLAALGPTLRLNKLEGDAIFLYAPEVEIDGSTLMDALENAYFAFQRRLRSIRQATTCQCNACRTIPNLNLKFCAHHGGFVRQRIMGQEELAGRDIILVHRLLKNGVAERFGLHGYGLLTTACADALQLDPAALRLQPHTETYEHIGEVPGYVYDLQRRWQEELETRRVRLTPEEADVYWIFDLPAPVQLVWEWNTDASRRTQWAEDVVRVDVNTVGGRRGVGTTNHCVHGHQDSHLEEIVDWRPIDYLSYLVKSETMGESLVTEVHEAVAEQHSRLHWMMRVQTPETRAMMADPQHRPMFEQSMAEFKQIFERSLARLTEILQQVMAARHTEVAAAEQARHKLKETAAHYWETREGWVEAGTPP